MKKLFTGFIVLVVGFIIFSKLFVISGGIQNIPLYLSTKSITLLSVIQNTIIPIIGIIFLLSLYKQKGYMLSMHLFFGGEIFFSLLNSFLPFYFYDKIHTLFPDITSHTSSFFSNESILWSSIIYAIFLAIIWGSYFFYLNNIKNNKENIQ